MSEPIRVTRSTEQLELWARNLEARQAWESAVLSVEALRSLIQQTIQAQQAIQMIAAGDPKGLAQAREIQRAVEDIRKCCFDAGQAVGPTRTRVR